MTRKLSTPTTIRITAHQLVGMFASATSAAADADDRQHFGDARTGHIDGRHAQPQPGDQDQINEVRINCACRNPADTIS